MTNPPDPGRQPDQYGQGPYGGSQPPGTGQPPGAGQYGQGQYGGQPGQYGQYGAPGQYGRPGQFAPVGGTQGAYAPPPPPPKKSKAGKIIAIVAAVLVVVVGGLLVVGYFASRDDGKSVDTTKVGSCLEVTGTTNVETKAVDCGAAGLNYIVASKSDTADTPCGDGYSQVTEVGKGGGGRLCLVPNLKVGTCYETRSVGVGINLKESACISSTNITTRFKVTQRADAATVPSCTNVARQKVQSYDKPKALTYCFEIQGSQYKWQ